MKTLVVNLFAGPGAGKSTGACYVFSFLKQMGIDCEYVSEFAKEKVWEHNIEVLKCQFYISGKQAYKISRVNGKVDVIITDSPILLGAMYGEDNNRALKLAILDEFHKYDNLNFFINRTKEYNPNGRTQTEQQANDIDMKMKSLLAEENEQVIDVTGDIEGYNTILTTILKELGGVSPVELPYVLRPDTDIITSNFLNKNGGIFVGEGAGISSIQYKFEKDTNYETGFHLTWNGYDDTWTYKDYRNRVYGLRFKGQLQALLLILGLRWEDYFAE